MQLFCNLAATPPYVVAWYADGVAVPADAHPGTTPITYTGDMAALGQVDSPAGHYAAPPLVLADLQARLCVDIDAQAEAQRAKYITTGSGQAMVYLQKQSQAILALQAAAATPPMSAADGAAAFLLLAAEVGITVDPATNAAATDVFGVARQVVATVKAWLPIGAAIEGERLKAKTAINTATTAAAAQAARDAVAWPSP